MEFRLAEAFELEEIKAMFSDLVMVMKQNGVDIWDEVYPVEFFKDDIAARRLYILKDSAGIACAFVLCGHNQGEGEVDWDDPGAKALYIDRLGVAPERSRQGIGGLALEKAKEEAAARGCVYLRLFVVDINEPAIRLYEKSGFKRADGIYQEIIDQDLTLNEYGYEIKI